MREVWNKVYQSDSTFFGEEPSNFALLMKINNLKYLSSAQVTEEIASFSRQMA
jgi:hypothetical protein